MTAGSAAEFSILETCGYFRIQRKRRESDAKRHPRKIIQQKLAERCDYLAVWTTKLRDNHHAPFGKHVSFCPATPILDWCQLCLALYEKSWYYAIILPPIPKFMASRGKFLQYPCSVSVANTVPTAIFSRVSGCLFLVLPLNWCPAQEFRGYSSTSGGGVGGNTGARGARFVAPTVRAGVSAPPYRTLC